MLDRRNQIENVLQSFHTVRNRLLKGSYAISAQSRIPNSQWMVLQIVDQNEGIGIKELSRLLVISSSAATQLVDSLVNKGHLVREESQADRRALRIKLSGTTQEMLRLSRTQALEKISLLFEVLSDDELQKLCDLSKKLAGGILEKQGT